MPSHDHTEQPDCTLEERLIPSAWHGSASELIHDNDFLAACDVVDILDLQLLRFQGIRQVAGPLLTRVIQVLSLKIR